MNHKRLYTIKTINMYNYLIHKGFTPIEIVPNIYIPNFVVWKFEDTKELRKTMEQYKKVNK